MNLIDFLYVALCALAFALFLYLKYRAWSRWKNELIPLGDSLNAAWSPEASSESYLHNWTYFCVGVIAKGSLLGELNKRPFEIGSCFLIKSWRKMAYIACNCDNAGSQFTLHGKPVGWRIWLVRQLDERYVEWMGPLPSALDATVRKQIYTDRAFLNSESGRLFKKGFLSIQHEAVVWLGPEKKLTAEHLGRILVFIERIAQSVEKTPVKIPQGAMA